ncbi:plasmid stabilization protein ParE [Arsukibacterium sp. MJ3]|uniref:type II toxin-antitoxin system RelE/ParE family toxin n=1 Tax=Arsukibacterium sp. MJ3 TaxID=1632859 RepID=UPI0006270B48|nr:type II toxin-antitoxin system mRNA interferase toxin, RelE/StbE family [Arsukibacterium sp. MJ3]KKO48676.1 plasmid stabilization protein ParE [Arsukibacterium sp. MJ3]
MIFWEEESLNDREKIFKFLFDFNPDAAEKTDQIIESKVEHLLEHPLMDFKRDIFRGRVLIIPEITMIISYWVDGETIRIMRVLHQKQKFPQE